MPNVLETADAAATTSTAYTLQAGDIVQGTIGTGGDHDFYRVNLVAGQTYTFAMVGTGINNVTDTYLRLLGSDGTTQLAFDDDGLQGLNSVITFTASSTGVYYIDAAGFNAQNTGQYGVSFTAGGRASFDAQMGAGVIDTDLSWSLTPGTGVNVTWAARTTNAGQTDAQGHPAQFVQLSAAQIAAVTAALQLISDVSGITFTRVDDGAGYSDSASMLFGAYNVTYDGNGDGIPDQDGAGAYASYPQAGDVSLNLNSVSTTSLPNGGYSFFAILHEIGHAVGLSHPGLYNAAPGVNITYAANAQFTQDTHQYSVMSYFDESNTTTSYGAYPDGLMLHDILALQNIYGANTTTRAGDTVYGNNSNAGGIFDFASNTSPAFSIWDGGGRDTLDSSAYSGAQTLNLNAGAFSNLRGLTGNVSIAIGAVIENAVGGSGNDTMIGNAVNNAFTAGAGTNSLNGGAGTDAANYSVSSGSVSIVHNANGTTTISGAGFSDTLTSVERAVFTGGTMVSIREGINTMDFNGEGTSDVLIRDSATGTIGLWQISNSAVVQGVVPGVADGWTVVATGDINGDAMRDIVLTNASTGAITSWQMNGFSIGASVGLTNLGVNSPWQIIGSGDFTGDGTTDMLLRNATTGAVAGWQMGNGAIQSGLGLGNTPATWQLADTGDFNNDGTTDIIWRDTATGQVAEWLVSNGAVTQGVVLGTATSDWQIAGSGDFNGDGTADLLWRNTTSGAVAEWLMQNGQLNSSQGVGNLSSDWQIVSIGDYNGDGTSDILWHNTVTGSVAAWNMSNGALATATGIATMTGTWSIIPA